ncbi:peptidoglycan -binding protein [Parvularcula sp. ZS-1/3]|uniref:Peptidoglycan -binding protein n=1 Tax=Parvularcula mediterranea TaxID=2732508 RepID=A0A7Y3RL29_9PROT|nr:peptidoglycan -binding protein [Parvularcula mediterranea]NNU16064.1 peptidoglycan -binding protein [Parvularcula mediterranea]
MARRRSRGGEAAIWPGFVDGLSSLILVLMVVLSLFVVAQFYLGEALTQKDTELNSLRAQIAKLAEDLGLKEAENQRLAARIVTLEDEIKAGEERIAALVEELAVAGSAIAASAEELQAEKALSEEQKSEIATLNAQLAALRKQLASLQEALEAAEAKDLEQQAQIENLSQRLNAALARKVSELAEVRSRFFEELRKALGDRDDVRVVGDRFVFESDVLFGSCSSTISPQGKLELDKLADVLLEIRGQIPSEIAWVIRVDGHADQEALGPACRLLYDSNWHLSAERAISVVRHLQGRGVPGNRLVAAGFGEYQPLVQGRDAASLAQNRRIEFKLTER